VFDGATPAALEQAIERVVALYRLPRAWRQVMLRAMAKDYSWDGAAPRYIELYRQAMETRRARPRDVSGS
jgi:starch synthase